mmetsp:Transcript_81336/g.230867  ORF Transcript_81336/g.230867 Transcript_81336/m.230867 type:complete len:223 (+) Transcript_81336:1026-1694(+)
MLLSRRNHLGRVFQLTRAHQPGYSGARDLTNEGLEVELRHVHSQFHRAGTEAERRELDADLDGVIGRNHPTHGEDLEVGVVLLNRQLVLKLDRHVALQREDLAARRAELALAKVDPFGELNLVHDRVSVDGHQDVLAFRKDPDAVIMVLPLVRDEVDRDRLLHARRDDPPLVAAHFEMRRGGVDDVEPLRGGRNVDHAQVLRVDLVQLVPAEVHHRRPRFKL